MSNLIAATVTAASAVKTGSLQDAAGGSPSTPQQIQQGRAKVWFNLNGTGTIAARDTFNVSSFVDNGVGDYTANFAVAQPSADWVAASATWGSALNALNASPGTAAFLRTTCTVSSSAAAFDPTYVEFAVSGD